MAADLLSKWLTYYRPLTLAQFGNARVNALGLTCGQFWVRTAGGYNLFRWTGDRWPTGAEQIVGASTSEATCISTFGYVVHTASTHYWYTVSAVGAGGVEASESGPVVSLVLDEAGSWLGPVPNAPEIVSVEATLGGAIIVRWRYTPTGQAVAPVSFNVYTDGCTGQVDWDSPAGTTPYRTGTRAYSWTSAVMADGVKSLWAVRAVSAAGREEPNQTIASVWADAVGPEPVGVLFCRADRQGTR